MKITSEAFSNNGRIPKEFTCDGTGIHPPLLFEDIPENTKSLTLIADDPDAPEQTWVHWVVYDMPVIQRLEKGITPPGKQGLNDYHELTYGGPCPPTGSHRYVFKLYALDTLLNFPEGKKKQDVVAALSDHVIDQCELVGTYAREEKE